MKVKVKICATRSLEAAEIAANSGADFLGMVFTPLIKTHTVDLHAAREIGQKMKGKINLVGVFQNMTFQQVKKIIKECDLDYAQFHGDEPPEYLNKIDIKKIKAFRFPGDFDMEKAQVEMQKFKVDYYLVDRIKQSEGPILNLEKVSILAAEFPLIFAGGLNPENVADVIKKVKPIMVDVASGVETSGAQDLEKIKKFIKNAKKAVFLASEASPESERDAGQVPIKSGSRQVGASMTIRQANGHFGKYGGAYVPEMLIPALEELDKEYTAAKNDKEFQEEFTGLLKNFAGRPTPLTFAKNLTEKLGGAKIYLKNEGLNHTGAHKITHCIGQALIAKRLGKTRLIAETGAGMHGVATATVAAKFGFECTIYMGEVDIERQRPNVFLMEQLGAEVVSVKFGSRTLKDAVNAAIKNWIERVEDTHYLLGSVLGPHPYPTMNRDFQSVVGREIKKQIKEQENVLPDYVVACVSGGSNAMGAFTDFLNEPNVKLIGVEAGGIGKKVGEHAARFSGGGSVGVAQGYKTYFLQDSDGQLQKTHSISAGLDYAGVGPEIANLYDQKRLEMVSATDEEVLRTVQTLAKTEGIIPALESAHAIAHAIKLAPTLSKNKVIVVNLSGRGDKDIFILTRAFKDKKFYEFMMKLVEEGI